MKNTDIIKLTFKGIALLILDIITFLIVFSVWALVNIKLFPWALSAILISLILVHLMVLASNRGIQIFGIGAYVPALITTIGYYIFTMAFTALSYVTISRGYMIVFFIASLLYTIIIGGLYTSGIKKNQDDLRQETEKAKVMNITLLFMEIHENIKACIDFVDNEIYAAIIKSYDEAYERLNASTPFGRINKPIVLNSEEQIYSKLSSIKENLGLIKTTEGNDKFCKAVLDLLVDVKDTIIRREKLIIN